MANSDRRRSLEEQSRPQAEPRKGWLGGLNQRAQELKLEVEVMLSAVADPDAGWAARAVLLIVLAYAISPIDLIPDFIPVLGVLDDLIIVPAGIALAIRLMPPAVLERHRQQIINDRSGPRARTGWLRWIGAIAVVLLWAAAAWLIVRWFMLPLSDEALDLAILLSNWEIGSANLAKR